MRANELRIGNYVCKIDRSKEIHLPVTAYPLFVQSISLFYVSACWVTSTPIFESTVYQFSTNDLSPIPITEEWLYRLWFASNPLPEKYSSLGRTNCMTCSNMVSVTPEDGRWYPIRGYDGISYGIGLNYVHQIQNLYFALTGEELTIKETV